MKELLRRGVRVRVSSLETEPPLMAANPGQIANRRCGATGAVTCVFTEEDTFYVLHDDGRVAPYRNGELTVEEASATQPSPSCSDGPFLRPAPAA